MAKLVSKSGTKSDVWDYFGLELETDEKPLMMAGLHAEVVEKKCKQSTMFILQSDLTYPHTSVSGGFADKVRELNK